MGIDPATKVYVPFVMENKTIITGSAASRAAAVWLSPRVAPEDGRKATTSGLLGMCVIVSSPDNVHVCTLLCVCARAALPPSPRATQLP